MTGGGVQGEGDRDGQSGMKGYDNAGAKEELSLTFMTIATKPVS